MYIITNGKVITPKTILTKVNLVIKEDRIAGLLSEYDPLPEGYEIIDAKGAYVSPGFIDIHSDYIETVTSPRPNMLMDLSISFKECEKILCAHGITTMFHSLSFYNKDAFGTKPIRDLQNVQKIMQLIDESHDNKHLIRHRLHARVELDNIKEVDCIMSFIKENKIHLLSLMDHTPGQGQYRDLEVYKKTLQGYGTLGDQDFQQLVEHEQSKEKISLEVMEEMIALAKAHHLAVASHDDDTPEKVAFIKGLGMTISEFPITMEVAECARENGLHTIAGAPNVLLGRSHSGNLSAAEGIMAKRISILCSDYHPAALLHAIFILHEKYGQDLCEMFQLVTLHPAEAVNLANQIGSIEIGKKADLILIKKDQGQLPKLKKVFVDGKLICEFNDRR